ncbi:MAG: hypothetical protein R3E03_06295 [Novosphingobium sp.]
MPPISSRGSCPRSDELVAFADPAKDGAVPLALKRLGGIKGDQLSNAQQGFDDRTNAAIVTITFDQAGGAKFAKLTTENVNRRFAIVLDGKILSAPVIQGRSSVGPRGFRAISRSKPPTSWRSRCARGALPVDLKVVEERSVGPGLGADRSRRA